jgi:hypothetical protein
MLQGYKEMLSVVPLSVVLETIPFGMLHRTAPAVRISQM